MTIIKNNSPHQFFKNTHPKQNAVPPRHQLEVDLMTILIVEIRQVVGDETLTERTHRLVHQRHGKRTIVSPELLALRHHVTALRHLIAVTPKIRRHITGATAHSYHGLN